MSDNFLAEELSKSRRRQRRRIPIIMLIMVLIAGLGVTGLLASGRHRPIASVSIPAESSSSPTSDTQAAQAVEQKKRQAAELAQQLDAAKQALQEAQQQAAASASAQAALNNSYKPINQPAADQAAIAKKQASFAALVIGIAADAEASGRTSYTASGPDLVTFSGYGDKLTSASSGSHGSVSIGYAGSQLSSLNGGDIGFLSCNSYNYRVSSCTSSLGFFSVNYLGDNVSSVSGGGVFMDFSSAGGHLSSATDFDATYSIY